MNMIYCIVLLFLVPLTFAKCPIKPDPAIYNDTRWQAAFIIYRNTFNKSYSDRDDECHSTILYHKIKENLNIRVAMFLGGNKDLDGIQKNSAPNLVQFAFTRWIVTICAAYHLMSLGFGFGTATNIMEFGKAIRIWDQAI